MSKGKRWLIAGIILSVLSLLFYAGLAVGVILLERHIAEYTAEWHQIQYVAFAKEDSEKESPQFISVEEFEKTFEEKDLKYSRYNTYTYYNNIDSEEDKFMYRLYEYALDNNTPYIYMETSLYRSSFSIDFMLKLFSMDSAVVDQNTIETYTIENFDTHNRYLYIPMTKTINCACIYVEDFNEEKAEKIDKSIAKAQETLDDLNINDTHSEVRIAEKIYLYLGKNVEYKEYNSVKGQALLYDALINGASNCDGYANAFALMCSLQGITCCEKMNITDMEDVSGHTWNTVKLDGVWYNVDATSSPSYYKGNLKGIPYRFGYSDSTQLDRHLYSDFVPECTQDLIVPDVIFKSGSDEGIAQKAADAIHNTDKEYILLVFDELEPEDKEAVMEEIVDIIYRGISYVTIEGSYHTLVFVFPE